MTFTFDESLTAERDKVRHHIGDIDSTRAWFSDAYIAGVIALEGSWQKAVISCIKSMILQLSVEPDMRADWLQTSYATGLKYLNDLLKLKANELGVSAGATVTGSVTHTYRPDSNQTESIDYDD